MAYHRAPQVVRVQICKDVSPKFKGGLSLKDVSLPPVTTPLLKLLRDHYLFKYTEEHGKNSGKGFYSNHDWRRIQHALTLLSPGSKTILDVGVGPGALLNYLQLSGTYEHVTGIDIRTYSKLIMTDEATDYRIMDATDMPFEDNTYDTVVCMEVLEHLQGDLLTKAIAQLRRVARRQLIMSVPFDEPKPLPSYHHQHFDEARLAALFPQAEQHLLQRPHRKGWPWAILVETYS